MAPETLVHPVRQASMQITAIQKPGQHLFFYRAGEVSTGLEFVVMVDDTLI